MSRKKSGSSTSITTSKRTSITTCYPYLTGKGEGSSGRVSGRARGSLSTSRAPSGTEKGTSSGVVNLVIEPAADGAQDRSIKKPATRGGEPPETKPDATENERGTGGGAETDGARSGVCPDSSSGGRVVSSSLHNQCAAPKNAGSDEREIPALAGVTNGRGSRVADSLGVVAVVVDSGSEDVHDRGGFWVSRAKQRAWDVVVSPVILALMTGIIICVILFLQDMFFHDPDAFLRPLGGAIQVRDGVVVSVGRTVFLSC